MGNFLEAFHHTGYYYPFVGFMQVTAAVLLLIPRTATLGALIYFPIILNICVLSLALRFDGSLMTAPLMLCAVLYLMCWDYHKFKNILPFKNSSISSVNLPQKSELSHTFPKAFFAGVAFVILLVTLHARFMYQIVPRNTITDCLNQCEGEDDLNCVNFCDCIHAQGKSLDECLEQFKEK
jgi:uncharacterized membrane protein